MTHGDGPNGSCYRCHSAVVNDGVLDYTGGKELWSVQDLRRLDEQGILGQNWKAQWEYALSHPAYLELCKEIVATGGPVLEVAAGPGGGNLSPIKHLGPETPLILNDYEYRLLKRWSHYMRVEHPELPVTYAAFDICSMPLADGSMACVSSAGGISNVLGSHQEVIRECARVLRPGGILGAMELVLTERCLASLPAGLVKAMAYHPWLFGEWVPLFQDAGMTIVSDIAVEQRFMDPRTSALALDASSFGATLEVEYRCILAKK